MSSATSGAAARSRLASDTPISHYRRLFDSLPDLRAEIPSRICVGSYVVDEERVSGRPDGDMHAVAIYRLDSDGLIDRARFLR